MRVDRFFEARFPGLSFSHIQRVIRKGEVRVNGKRTQPKNRLEVGQTVRIPPLRLDAPKPRSAENEADQKTSDFLKSITLYEDADVLVFNKPMGLAVQGGSGTTRHIDGMLEVLRDARGQRPRLVHRLDKDTAGCLLIAKTRFAAAALAKSFRSRSTRKIYWALVAGVPKVQQGRISTFLAKEQREDESLMRIARHGEEGASHAVTYYAVVETAGPLLAWLSLKPVTGRTHQLRAHMAHIDHAIIGDAKYFAKENWELPGGMQRPAASSRPPYRHTASARRHDRCHRTTAPAYAAVVESSWPRRQALRSDRGSAGRVARNNARTAGFKRHAILGACFGYRDFCGCAGARLHPGDDQFPNSIMAPEPGTKGHHRTPAAAAETTVPEPPPHASLLGHEKFVDKLHRGSKMFATRGSSGSVLPTPLPRTPLMLPEGGSRPIEPALPQQQGPTVVPRLARTVPNLRMAPRHFRTAPRAARSSPASTASRAPRRIGICAPACSELLSGARRTSLGKARTRARLRPA